MNQKVYIFEGKPYGMGLQHGESLGYLVRDLAAERIDLILSTFPQVTPSNLREICEEIVAEIELQVPEVYEEISGIARGAAIELWELVVAGGYSDVEHRASIVAGRNGEHIISECTLFPARNRLGHLLLAGTWDSHATAGAALVVIERRPEHGPATLALTTAGWPMQQGVNSSGLGFAIANVVPTTTYRGITYIAALPRIAAQPNVSCAVNSAMRLRLCSGRYYALCDESGCFAGLESDGYNYWVDHDLKPHTNHYVHPDAKKFEGRKKYSESSEERRLSAERRLLLLRNMDIFGLFSILSFNDKTNASISQLGLGRETRTGAGFVIDPVKRVIHYTVGPPTESSYMAVHLRDPERHFSAKM